MEVAVVEPNARARGAGASVDGNTAGKKSGIYEAAIDITSSLPPPTFAGWLSGPCSGSNVTVGRSM